MEWQTRPRPLAEFFRSFQAPGSKDKWAARVKCNIYYYRANYAVLIVLCFAVSFYRNPYAIAALLVSLFSVLLTNDTFASSFSDKVLASSAVSQPPQLSL